MFDQLDQLLAKADGCLAADSESKAYVRDAIEVLRQLRAGVTPGIGAFAMERARQVLSENFDDKHDKLHTNGELVSAAIALAAPYPVWRECRTEPGRIVFKDPFPWIKKWDKRHEPMLRRIEIAGALLAAEYDRLLAAQKEPANEQT